MTDTARKFSGGGPSGGVEADEVAIYRPKERTVRVSAYVPATTQRDLRNLGSLWSALDAEKWEQEKVLAEKEKRPPAPPPKPWSESDIAERLIMAALDGAWAELGGRPESDVELKQRIAIAVKLLKAR